VVVVVMVVGTAFPTEQSWPLLSGKVRTRLSIFYALVEPVELSQEFSTTTLMILLVTFFWFLGHQEGTYRLPTPSSGSVLGS